MRTSQLKEQQHVRSNSLYQVMMLLLSQC